MLRRVEPTRRLVEVCPESGERVIRVSREAAARFRPSTGVNQVKGFEFVTLTQERETSR